MLHWSPMLVEVSEGLSKKLPNTISIVIQVTIVCSLKKRVALGICVVCVKLAILLGGLGNFYLKKSQ